MNTIKIIVPKLPSQEDIYLKGYIDKPEKSDVTIYITKYSENKALLNNTKQDSENTIYGYVGCFSRHIPYQNVIYMEHNPINMKNLKLNNQEIVVKDCIIMIYDYDEFKDSQAITNTDCFTKLVNSIQDKHGSSLNVDFTTPSCLHISMFLQHTYNYWIYFKWLITPLTNRKYKMSMKHRSLILAILLDLVFGYIVLQLLPQDKAAIALKLVEVLQELVNLLRSLLEWLTGAPVGLKLNKALSEMLGYFFTFHVQLWKLFVDVSKEVYPTLVDVYWCIGYLGLTFQIAFISDWIRLVTFHVYCFYGYAARLYNIHISAFRALVRLFVGRKYNPLKSLNDSCEYTKEELFLGTLAFTIILLLLPTTIIYYIVFTGFRVVSLMVQNILAKLIYLVQTLPLYVMWLWVIRSPILRGNFVMEVINTKGHRKRKVRFSIDTEDKVKEKRKANDNVPLALRIKLVNKPIPELVKLFKPPVVILTQVEWTKLFSNILYGNQF